MKRLSALFLLFSIAASLLVLPVSAAEAPIPAETISNCDERICENESVEAIGSAFTCPISFSKNATDLEDTVARVNKALKKDVDSLSETLKSASALLRIEKIASLCSKISSFLKIKKTLLGTASAAR